MADWVLSDGTVVRPGGTVSGDSVWAGYLRVTFTGIRAGTIQCSSGYGPIPHEAPLDLDQSYLLDAWLRRRFGAEVVSGPDVTYPPHEPRPPEPPGCVY